MKFPIIDFFSKCDQIHKKLYNSSYLLIKPLTENLIFLVLWEKEGEGETTFRM